MSTLVGYDRKLGADVTFRSANKELLRVNSAGLRSTNESVGTLPFTTPQFNFKSAFLNSP